MMITLISTNESQIIFLLQMEAGTTNRTHDFTVDSITPDPNGTRKPRVSVFKKLSFLKIVRFGRKNV